MTNVASPTSHTPFIAVDPLTGMVTVLNSGPVGPTGETGPIGPQGPQGIPGPPILLGAQDSIASLPASPSVGDAWLLKDTLEVVIWDGDEWVNMGSIQGPPGTPADITVIVSDVAPGTTVGDDGTIWFQIVTVGGAP